jgi:hypothetical protein
MFFDKSATKSVVFKLDLQWNQMILTVILGFGLLYFNAKFNHSDQNKRYLVGNFPPSLSLFF